MSDNRAGRIMIKSPQCSEFHFVSVPAVNDGCFENKLNSLNSESTLIGVLTKLLQRTRELATSLARIWTRELDLSS